MEWQLLMWIVSLLFMIFFAGVEMAFFGASRLNIELKRKQGTLTGRLLGKFVDTPAIFWGTTVIGYITALTIFVLQTSEVLIPFWQKSGINSRTAQILLEIAFNTLIILIFVEFIPRAVFRANSNTLLSRLAMIINFFLWLLYPITAALFRLSNWILKYVFNVRLDKGKSPFARNDLQFMFRDSRTTLREETSTHLLENAQELANIKIRQSMVPRKEIIAVEVNAPVETLIQKFIETKRSRIIIYESNIDNILGFAHELDLFKKPADIESILIPIIAVPESMTAVGLINKFSKESKSIAWVVDEFGGTAGIITMEDVLEELFGEIWDEYDTQLFVEKRISEDEYIFSGRMELDYLEKKYDFEFEDKEDSETLSGYIINFYETIPAQKERIIIGDFEFDVLGVNDTRIEMVKMKKLK
ncbi:hemolysin family protein [Niabella drilacis]|uniref:Hemolysin, contains CBS domains n=1 Tax=Niabella drilacis (strain DSM 25811 / CCM 8410 / CCUG 62505 / LMG 26954 / E90) TaxID=1285928 RepID=A0A1G6N351_NIADE|nr:hemolysin family protein [Niabella drilacis]SDC62121.1 Hemolysin, contains CBS domains [Niabella drilacis]